MGADVPSGRILGDNYMTVKHFVREVSQQTPEFFIPAKKQFSGCERG
jgi:hypothetical protein